MSTSRPTAPILVVDDEIPALHGVRRTLRSHGFETVLTCSDGRETLTLIEKHDVQLLLLDLIMPYVGGEEILEKLARDHPEIPVIVVTAEYDVRAAVRCMKLGAVDFVCKPIDGGQLITTIERALEQSALRFEAKRLREKFLLEELEKPEAFSDIVTTDPAMLRVFGYLEAISRGSQPVLVAGETGTGKELVSKALHQASNREGPFVAVNVAGLDDTMFADTLFGHRPGAFTGADQDRKGMVEKANEGTLFLDEIGDLSEASQVKLLRLIQEQEYYPLGSDVPCALRARVIAATHKDPSTFRPDLYYRLRSYQVTVPPLRDRLGDLPLLIDHFLVSAAEDLGKLTPKVPSELYVYLSNYEFPGNVRELQAMVFDAVARHEGGVMPIQLFLDQIRADEIRPPRSTGRIGFPFPMPSLRDLERAAVEEAMARVDGNQSAAARMLGVSRPTIGRHVKRAEDGEAS